MVSEYPVTPEGTTLNDKVMNLLDVVVDCTWNILDSLITLKTWGEHEQESQDREGCVYPLRRWDRSNGSSPRPAGLGVMEHVINLDSLNVTVNEG